MKNRILFISILLISGLTLSACSDSNETAPPSPSSNVEEKIVKAEQKPSHKDEYGCVFADDYVWCEATKKCIKKLESCEEVSGAQKPKRSYDLIEEALAKKLDLTVDDFKTGIQKLTLSHFRGVVQWEEERTQLLASKENNDWVIVYEGESGQYTCESVEPFSFPNDMITDCQL